MDLQLDFFSGLFLPEFRRTSDPQEILNQVFFGLIVVGFFTYLIIIICKYFKQAKALKILFRKLKNKQADDAAAERAEIAAFFNSHKNPISGAWKAFDTNLLVHTVYDESGQSKKQLRNPLSAGDFFNSDTLNLTLGHNRLISAAPAILTGLGVLGTFIGLLMGLVDLSMLQTADLNVGSDINAKNQLADELTTGIFGMIAGAATAFKTSVWGVSGSLFINIIEKIFVNKLYVWLNKVQNCIDNLYCHIDIGEFLQSIEDHSRKSSEMMATLAEKIGDKLQESMTEAGNMISQSLENSLIKVLEPALNRLADTTQNQVERAGEESQNQLTELLSSFQNALEKAGHQQGSAMNDATVAMREATQGLAEKLNNMSQELSASVKSVNESCLSSFKSVEQSLKSQAESNVALIKNNRNETEDLFLNISSVVSDIKEDFEKGNSEQLNNNRDLIAALTQLKDSFETLGKANELSSVNMKDAAGILNTAGQNFTEAASGISGSMRDISNSVHRASNSADVLAGRVKEGIELVSRNEERLQSTLGSVTELNKEIQESAKLANTGFNNLSGQYSDMTKAASQHTDALNKHIRQVSEEVKAQMAAFSADMQQQMNKYSAGLQEQMNQYNEKLQEQMTQSSALLKQQIAQYGEDLQQQMEQYAEEQKKYVKELEEQLTQYNGILTEGLQDRMNIWNKQTAEYTTAMTDAVNSISTVVDDIDSKLGKVR